MPVSVYFRKNQPVQITKLRRCLECLLKLSGMKGAQLEINLVGETRIQKLNRRYLQRNRVTDVLSFPIEKKPVFPGVPWALGEIFIATPVARRQAGRAGRNLTTQVIRRFLNYLHRKGLCPWDGLLQF
jgi:probable rRNA maturation factor